MTDLNETFKNRRTAVTDQINRLYASAGTIDDLAKADYENVKRLARLPDLSTQGIAKLLLGREILQRVNTYMSYADFARTHIPKYTSKPENEEPPRFKGQNISFPVERSYPKWWIQKIAISGGEDKNQNPAYFYAKGEIKNVSANDSAPCSATNRRTKAGLIAASVRRRLKASISSSVKPTPFLRNPDNI